MTGGGPDSTNIPYFVYQRSIGGGWEFGKAVGVQPSSSCRVDHRRHHRPARAVPAAQGRGDRLMAGATPLGVGERRSVNVVMGIVAWLAALLFFFPVFWMVLSSFKEEQDANTSPKLFFSPDARPLQRRHRDRRPGCCRSARRSSTRSGSWWSAPSSCSLLAIPAAYALAIRPVPKWRDVLFFFISTKFLPVVAVDPAAVDPRQGLRPAQHPARADDPLHRDEPAARGVDAALVLPGDPPRADRGGRDRRRRAEGPARPR